MLIVPPDADIIEIKEKTIIEEQVPESAEERGVRESTSKGGKEIKDGKVENAKAPKKKKEKKGNGVKEKIKVEETAEEISEASGEEK